jgi:hypothetical protein
VWLCLWNIIGFLLLIGILEEGIRLSRHAKMQSTSPINTVGEVIRYYFPQKDMARKSGSLVTGVIRVGIALYRTI